MRADRTFGRLAVARAVAAATAAVSLAAAALALADERTRPDPNDATGRLDIREVSAGHAPDGRLRHLIATTGRWGAEDLLSKKGPPGGVCLHIWTARRPSAGSPDYLVCANSDAKGRDLEGWVTHVSRRAGRTGRTVPAAVSRPDSRSVVLRFAQSQIGRPDRYYWRAETVYYAAGCPRATGCLDTAPDIPRASAHVLGRPEARTEQPESRAEQMAP